jgi:hypothetical protein
VLKRWVRHAKNISGEGKISGKDLIDFQVRNDKGLVDFINFQEDRGNIPIFQVDKGEELS